VSIVNIWGEDLADRKQHVQRPCGGKCMEYLKKEVGNGCRDGTWPGWWLMRKGRGSGCTMGTVRLCADLWPFVQLWGHSSYTFSSDLHTLYQTKSCWWNKMFSPLFQDRTVALPQKQSSFFYPRQICPVFP
jgi:hypothetical protein